MKYIKMYEDYSMHKMDQILDKITKSGMDSLTPSEKYYLETEGGELNDNLIDQIKNIVKRNGGDLTMAELEAESSPVYKEEGQNIDLIERLTDDYVEVISYFGYKYETEGDSYFLDYDELSEENINDIKDILDNAIEFGNIK